MNQGCIIFKHTLKMTDSWFTPLYELYPHRFASDSFQSFLSPDSPPTSPTSTLHMNRQVQVELVAPWFAAPGYHQGPTHVAGGGHRQYPVGHR